MNVRKRTGSMGKTYSCPPIANAVTQRGTYKMGGGAIAIANSVAMKPKMQGPTKVKNAITGPRT